jgi:hypothetical protein
MAQNVVIQLEDDIDGSPADETLTFALDGRDYEIDLSATNAEKLRQALRPFIAGSRPVPSRSSKTGAHRSAIRWNPDTPKIRKWAQANGHDVSDRGRIPRDIQDAYYAAAK